ncbi:MAG: Flp family type IVb pilin [Dehalococcoidia bacterium]
MAVIEQAMMKAITAFYSLKSSERGQGMAEYGLILALVAVVVIGALTALGGGISNKVNAVTAAL